MAYNGSQVKNILLTVSLFPLKVLKGSVCPHLVPWAALIRVRDLFLQCGPEFLACLQKWGGG